MCAPSAPATPDYAGAATAQGEANIDAARATAKLSNPNVINPYGTQTVTYGAGGTFDQAGYDKAMATYNAPQASVPTDDGTLSNILRTFGTLGQVNDSSTARVMPNRADFMIGGDPDVGTVTQTFSPEQQALHEKSTQTKGLLSDLGITGATALQGVVGKELDLSGAPAAPTSSGRTRDDVINAMMSPVNTDTTNQRDQRNSDLIAAGIRPGTAAYDTAMDQIDRQYNDARQSAITAGGAEASRDFGMDSQARKDSIAEILAQRQTPLNEINALMSGSQVSNPFASNLGYQAGASAQPAPIMKATELMEQAGQNRYAQGVGQSNATKSGLFSLGSAALPLMFSDRRLKRNITRIGTHSLGIGLYEWNYLWGEHSTGVMADEVRAVMPQAVTNIGGFDAVDYAMLGR